MINVIEWFPQTDTAKRLESFKAAKEFFDIRGVSQVNREQREMIDAMFNGAIYIVRHPDGVLYHRTLAELIREYNEL